jgi:hypothetical protein
MLILSEYVQVELCQTTDLANFDKAYAMYTWLLANLLPSIYIISEVNLKGGNELTVDCSLLSLIHCP